MTAPDTDRPLEPAARRKAASPRGHAVPIAGAAWVLSGDPPPLAGPWGVWDRLYDQNVLRGRYDPRDLRVAAVGLLRANYDLSADEAVALARAADPGALVAPVEAALLGARPLRSYSEWVRSALLANGLDPAAVPPGDLHNVLRQLVATGRAEPAASFVSSASAADRRKALLSPG